MRVKIKRFDKTIPLPEYKTKGAVCFDLPARVDVEIEAGQVGYIPLNIALEVPEGYWTKLAARSSTHKMGIIPANGIGIIDQDYRGDNDELKFAAYNYTDQPVKIEKGTRVAQIMILRCEQAEIEEVDTLESPDRGGFGTTGNL